MDSQQRTAPLTVVVGAIGSIRSAIIPAIAIAFSGIGGSGRYTLALGVALASVLIGVGVAYARWRRLTYTTGEADIRVESGIVSRNARSVPYERIQDVSLEARPLPRLFGLVSVKFETGAGGGDDLKLDYLTAAEGERLRQLVRDRRDVEQAAAVAGSDPVAPATPTTDEGDVLFAMDPRRLLTFGLFEFSLAVFAVLGGLLQYVDNVTGVEIWDFKVWLGWLEEQGGTVAALGPFAQALGALAGLIGLIVIGFGTGVVRTFLRDWGFTLTRSPRGFRRQRGLLTRTDVVMPVHRVQALTIGTGFARYRFGWHGLSFVSLAQDDKNESHLVAPFAQMDEIAPIARAAGFHLPDEDTRWHRASKRHRDDGAIIKASALVLAAIPTAIFAPFGLVLIPLGLALVLVARDFYAWEFRRHAIDESQVFASHGFLSPATIIATRLKLHSVEIAQGPLARWRGYATVHLGLAGGSFVMHGVPLADARALQAGVMETIAATDYSRLEQAARDQALSEAQSGLSLNLAAT